MSRRAKGREREEAVVEAARRAIQELGFHHVRVADIAERAQMSSSHVTYYFPSKDDLLMLAIRQSEERLVEAARTELGDIADPFQRLRRLIELSASAGPDDDGWHLWLQVWASGISDATISMEHRSLDQTWFGILRETIEYGEACGRFSVSSVDDAAELISAMIDGLSVQLTVGSDRVDRERVLDLCAKGASAILQAR